MFEFIVLKDETLNPLISPYCVKSINEKYEIWYYREEDLPPMVFEKSIYYAAIPKCLGLLESTALEVSGILNLQEENTLSLKGQGVFVAFFDTGINYRDEAFLNNIGETRIYAMWDQTQGERIADGNCEIGAFYTREEINEALQNDNPEMVVPEKDEDGHGTFLASVACGSVDLVNDFAGAAPEAELLVVKLRPANRNLQDFYFVPKETTIYAESDLMLGIAWAEKIAREQNRPLVICLGLGCNNGNHNGGGRLCDYLDDLAKMRHRGIVIASGNEALQQHHYLGVVESEDRPTSVEINVEKDMRGFYLEIWDIAPENLAIGIKSPTGEIRPVNGKLTKGSHEFFFLYESTRVTVDLQNVGRSERDQLIYVSFSNVKAGIWTLFIHPQNIVNGIFHIWLPMGALLDGKVYFLKPNPDTTLTMPADAQTCMAVGGYQATTGATYIESGRGFLAGGRIKPDFIAPAVNISGKGLRGQYITNTGTSVAAAITAGAAALILEWAVTRRNAIGINSVDIKNLLIRGCKREQEQEYPNQQNGYGKLDIQLAFDLLRRQ